MGERCGDALPSELEWAGELGASLRGARPTWKFTTRNRHVAEELVRIFDGRLMGSTEEAGSRPGILEVQSEGGPMSALVADIAHIRNQLRLGPVETPVHLCDGEKRLAPMERVGSYCGCSAQLYARKAAARLGKGPKPDARLTFRLVQAPGLGYFDLCSESWDFAASLAAVCELVSLAGGPVFLQLAMAERRLLTRAGAELLLIQPTVTQSYPQRVRRAEFGLTA